MGLKQHLSRFLKAFKPANGYDHFGKPDFVDDLKKSNISNIFEMYRFIMKNNNNQEIGHMGDKELNELLIVWDQSVDRFFDMMAFVGLKDDMTMTLKKHIKSIDDLNRWIDHFDGNIDVKAIELTSRKYITSIKGWRIA